MTPADSAAIVKRLKWCESQDLLLAMSSNPLFPEYQAYLDSSTETRRLIEIVRAMEVEE